MYEKEKGCMQMGLHVAFFYGFEIVEKSINKELQSRKKFYSLEK